LQGLGKGRKVPLTRGGEITSNEKKKGRPTTPKGERGPEGKKKKKGDTKTSPLVT